MGLLFINYLVIAATPALAGFWVRMSVAPRSPLSRGCLLVSRIGNCSSVDECGLQVDVLGALVRVLYPPHLEAQSGGCQILGRGSQTVMRLV